MLMLTPAQGSTERQYDADVLCTRAFGYDFPYLPGRQNSHVGTEVFFRRH